MGGEGEELGWLRARMWCAVLNWLGMSPVILLVREARKRKRLTQAQLAAKAHVRQATISLFESGEAQRVNLDVLGKIAHALDVPVQQLLRWVPEK